MGAGSRSLLSRWSKVFTLMVVLVLALSSCGRMTRSESLEVFLALPEGEDPGRFWFAVETRSIQVRNGKGETTNFPFAEGAPIQVDLKKGDRIVFAGVDHQGRLLVTGEASVGDEKKISVPLRRVL